MTNGELVMDGKTIFKILNVQFTALKILLPLLLLPFTSPIEIANFETPQKSPTHIESPDKLQAETDALLPLFDNMPAVPVFLKDEIINKTGSNVERGVAYTTCENKDQPTIYVKKVFYERTNQKQLVNILKHELTHAWQCRQGYMSSHDKIFQQKFKSVGGFGN